MGSGTAEVWSTSSALAASSSPSGGGSCGTTGWSSPWAQADAVAATIAASVGIDLVPRPFQPVLRGLLMAGGTARYMRAGPATDDCAVSERPLWWPPNRLCGRYLAPYLTTRVGGSAVMFHDGPGDLAARTRKNALGGLADLSLG